MAKRRRAVTRTVFSVSINIRVRERMDAFAKSEGRTVSEVVDRAIEEYLNRHDKPVKAEPSATATK